jgi:lysophospholipase L1-like esterase
MPRSSGFVLSLAACAAALALACHKTSTSPTPSSPPGPPAAGSSVRYAAVGASDAIGVGASVLCVPYVACADGTGYVPDIARQMQSEGWTVSLTNLGIPGAVIGRDIQAIAAANGNTSALNFIDAEMPFVPRDARLVTVFAGANDARTIADALDHGAGGNDPAAYVDAQVRAFAADYLTLVRGIRSRAPGAWVVAANLPNLAGLPYTAGYSQLQKQYVQKISVSFTTQAINTLAAESVPVIDLMCDPRSYQDSTYSSDGFHPNDTGYAYIASKFMEAIKGGGTPPPGTCPQMTLVPPI